MEPRYKDKGCSLSCVLQYYLQSQFLIVKALLGKIIMFVAAHILFNYKNMIKS